MSRRETCPAAVMPGPGKPVELRELPLPELEEGAALLRVEVSEVCGTDVYLREGRLAGVPYPIIPGHVSVGVLEKIRGTLLDIEGKPFTEGDRVTFLDVHRTCHRCWHCLVAKASTRCPDRKVYGITYGVEDGLTGGWSRYIHIKPGVRCIRLDGSGTGLRARAVGRASVPVPTETYMAGGCSLPTALHAVDRGDVRIGDSVLILGSGPVGLSAIAFSAMSGAASVLCIGAPANRLDAARHMGAAATLDFTEHSLDARIDWVRCETNGRGADVTIECTGAPGAVREAMQFTRDTGRVVVVGQYTDHGEAPFNPHLDLNKKHLDVRGCWGSDYSHFHRGVEMLRTKHGETWSALKLERFPLSRANEALDAIARAEIVKALIVPEP